MDKLINYMVDCSRSKNWGSIGVEETEKGVELCWLYPNRNEYLEDSEIKAINNKGYVVVKNHHLVNQPKLNEKGYHVLSYMVFDPKETSKDIEGVYFAIQKQFFDGNMCAGVTPVNGNIIIHLDKEFSNTFTKSCVKLYD